MFLVVHEIFSNTNHITYKAIRNEKFSIIFCIYPVCIPAGVRKTGKHQLENRTFSATFTSVHRHQRKRGEKINYLFFSFFNYTLEA